VPPTGGRRAIRDRTATGAVAARQPRDPARAGGTPHRARAPTRL